MILFQNQLRLKKILLMSLNILNNSLLQFLTKNRHTFRNNLIPASQLFNRYRPAFIFQSIMMSKFCNIKNVLNLRIQQIKKDQRRVVRSPVKN